MNSIKEAISAFTFHIKYEKKLSHKTIKAYTTDCEQFFLFCNKHAPDRKLEEINKEILKGFFYELKEMKPKTIKRKVATLKAMFNFLEFEDEIIINPFRKMKINIKEPKELPSVMNLIEIEKIFQAANENLLKHEFKSYKHFEKLRNLAVLELLFATGSRVSEISNLKVEDVDLIEGFIKINGKGSKQRIIQICHPAVIKTLKLYRSRLTRKMIKKGNFFVNRFGNKLSDQSIRIMVDNLTKQSKIYKKITPHTFRHSFATLMLEQNVDIKYIQGILGHSSIVTTQIYTHINNTKQREILTLNHPRRLIDFKLNKG